MPRSKEITNMSETKLLNNAAYGKLPYELAVEIADEYDLTMEL
jgi:hypothetical protein